MYIYIYIYIYIYMKLLIHAQMIFGRIYSQNSSSGCLWEGELRHRNGGSFYSMLSFVSFACIHGLKNNRLLILLSEAQRGGSLAHSHPLVTISLWVTVVLMSTGLAVRLGLGQAQLLAREEEWGGWCGTGLVQRSGNPQIHRNQNRAFELPVMLKTFGWLGQITGPFPSVWLLLFLTPRGASVRTGLVT